MAKYSHNAKGERYLLPEIDRKEIMRGTSWLDPKLLNATVSDGKNLCKRATHLIKKAMKNGTLGMY